MKYLIQQKALTPDQEKLINDGFEDFDQKTFSAKNEIKSYTFVIDSPEYVGSLKARLSWGNFHIVEVFVVEKMRGHGVGSALIKHALEIAKKDNARFVSIKTSNPKAKNLYEKLGFKVHNTLEGYSFDLKFYTLVYPL
ncbi:MAG: GNAT family N-acetyltransferase [Opitutales bacterium]